MKVRICWHCCASAMLGLLAAAQSLLLLCSSLLRVRSNGDHSSWLELEINASTTSCSGKTDSLGSALLRKGKATLMPWQLNLPLAWARSFTSLGRHYDVLYYPIANRLSSLLDGPWNISLCYAPAPRPSRWSLMLPRRAYDFICRYQSKISGFIFKFVSTLTLTLSICRAWSCGRN